MTIRKRYPAVTVAAALAMSLAVYTKLSDPVAIHWGLDGRANGWAGRPFGAFAVPLMMVAFAVLFRVLPDADPRKNNYEKFWSSYDIIAVATLTVCLATHAMGLATALGLPVPVNRIVPALVGAFYIMHRQRLPAPALELVDRHSNAVEHVLG